MNNCVFCNKSCKSFASKRQHEVRCNNNPNKVLIPSSSVSIPPTGCSFCSSLFYIKHALSNHERRCKENPKRILEKLTDGGLKSLIRHGKTNGHWNNERRLKHSVSMKKAVDLYPESFTSSNRGRTKQIIYNGIKFQGKWELDFYKWAEINNIKLIRVSRGFKYEWNGERIYFPDFYIPSLDTYIEVKGYETDRDIAKWSQFPHKLLIIKKYEIEKIRKGQFKGLTNIVPYCKV